MGNTPCKRYDKPLRKKAIVFIHSLIGHKLVSKSHGKLNWLKQFYGTQAEKKNQNSMCIQSYF